ncbi:DUF5627 domain-containing protein [Pedobacter alluvionis]|uniref:DUF1735 domain-containing protein n=1 Tax=Pedobacter alluvionis TaxID=475253 RepID=A0A497Y7P2_9SPHI|nr:DUF5627 domain-containing protein [Pedobacter alluvionis]RLJ79574.1 uncharacterized protein DUF1735 [Pedobacter alluvionis]TFB30910.1 DUF1735 domain-containing protein [Pedobacter alluvionis]
MKINHICMGLAAAIGLLSSCKNEDLVFPDYTYKAVYFANQYPLRTVVLGEDLLIDNTLDNEHKVSIKATVGGVNENKEKVTIGVKVDESLLDGLNFTNGGGKILALPSAYYKLGSSQISIEAGSILGGVDVQLTDAFFADPKSLSRNYVIPLVMTSVTGADSILKGIPAVTSPSRVVAANWITRPKDYVLYAVKYVNPWQGNYLRKGVDQITQSNGAVSTVARRTENVEGNQVVSISTTSLKVATLPLTIKNSTGNNVNFSLVLNFADGNNCTVTANSNDFDISGTGKFVSKGEKNSIGGTDRSAIYLDYTVNFKNLNVKYATKDTLIVRDRGIKAEYFDVVKN